MPIRINLLAESQAAEEMRRKDPVKRAVWIGGAIIVAFVLWIVNLRAEIAFKESEFATTHKSWTDLAPKYKAVTNDQGNTQVIEGKLSQLDSLTTNRFLWAPALNALQKCVVDNIEVTHIHGDQFFVPEDPKTKKVGVIERDSLLIDARDLSPDNQNYDHFKQTLNAEPYFGNHTGVKDSFVIQGVLGALTVDPNDPSREFVNFTLVSHFKDVHRDKP